MNSKPKDELYCGVRKERIDLAHPEINHRNAKHLVEFMTERWNIHIKKDIQGLPAPWTDNPILREFKFTNVFREDDRATRELLRLVSHNDRLTFEEKILNSILFRAWNNPETFTGFGGPWTAEEIYDGVGLKEKVRPLFHRLAKAEPNRLWWSSAYNQGGTKCAWKFADADIRKRPYKFGSDKELGDDKYSDWEPDIPLRVFHIGTWLKRQQIVTKLLGANNQQECFEILKSLRGFADFLAYQVFVDLTYIPEFPFSENEFTIAGPGCKKGLDYIFINRDGMTYEESLFYLRRLLTEDWQRTATKLRALFEPYGRCVNIMSLENCMCELSKYIRAVEGTGRPKNKYKPRKEKQ